MADPKDRFETKTPAHGTPALVEIVRQTRNTNGTATSALTSIEAMREELNASSRHNEVEHQRFADGISATQGEVKELGKQVQDLRVITASADGKLDILVADINVTKQVTIHRDKITMESVASREKVELEDAADAKKHRRAATMKVLAIIGTVLGVIATAITAYFAGRGATP